MVGSLDSWSGEEGERIWDLGQGLKGRKEAKERGEEGRTFNRYTFGIYIRKFQQTTFRRDRGKEKGVSIPQNK